MRKLAHWIWITASLLAMSSVAAFAQVPDLSQQRLTCARNHRLCQGLSETGAEVRACATEHRRCLEEAEALGRPALTYSFCYIQAYNSTREAEPSPAKTVRWVQECAESGQAEAVERGIEQAQANLKPPRTPTLRQPSPMCQRIQSLCEGSPMRLGGSLGPFGSGQLVACLVARTLCR